MEFGRIFKHLKSVKGFSLENYLSTDLSIIKGLGRGSLAAFSSIFILHTVLIQFDFSGLGILSVSPTILVGSLVTLTGLLATFVALSYNLTNKLPKKISRKYILHSELIWQYLGLQISFILISGTVIYLGLYNKVWSLIFAFELVASGLATVVFFVRYVQRTDKDGIYQLLAQNMPENYLPKEISVLGETEFDTLDIYQKSYRYVLTDEENLDNHGLMHSVTSKRAGIVKVDEDRLENFLEEYSEDVVKMIITRPGVFESRSRGFNDNILDVMFLRDFQDVENVLRTKISNFIEVEEVMWLEDWILCLNHSAKYEQERLEDDFNFLEEQIIDDDVDASIFMMVLDRLAARFAEEENNSRRMLSQSISLAYSTLPEIKENEWLAHQYLFSLKDLHIHYLISLQEKYDPRYPTVLLNINELGKFFYRERFLELEAEDDEVEFFEELFERHIDVATEIIQSTAENFFINPDVYSKYLRSLLENYDQLFSTFTKKDLKTKVQGDKEAVEMHQRKVKSISWIEDYKNEKGIEIFLFTLNEIQTGEIDYSVSELVFQFGSQLDFTDWKISGDYTRFSTMYNRENVLQFTAKFILVLQIYRKTNGLDFNLPETEDEQLKRSMEALTHTEVNKWIEINEDEFSEIKLDLEKALT